MRVGSRWAHGGTPHRTVPSSLHSHISEAERQYPQGNGWTLTWLEGRPVVTLDDSVRITVDEDGSPHVMLDSFGSLGETSDDDDWLTNE